jgi:acetyl-CoA synthetase
VHIVSQLPKTRTAKVMRRVIRGVYTGTPTGDLSSLDNPAALEEIARAANRAPPKV